MSEDRIAAFEARMAALKERMEAGLPARAEALVTAATRLEGDEPGARDEVRRIAHKLRGVAGTHGHAELSVLAGAVEDAARGEMPAKAVARSARKLARMVQRAAGATGAAASTPAPVAVTADPPATAEEPAGERPRVLAIEDDAATAKLLELTLNRLGGYDVEVASDGEQALALLLDHHFDVVICDAMMPGVTGPELCGALRSRDGWLSEVPVIMLSAASPQELGFDGVPAGATAWLRKPIRPRKFLEELEAVLAARA